MAGADVALDVLAQRGSCCKDAAGAAPLLNPAAREDGFAASAGARRMRTHSAAGTILRNVGVDMAVISKGTSC